MSKTLFDEVIGTPPPSTVDVQGIMRRRRRVTTLRRAGLAATSVVVVSAMVVAGLSFAPGRGGRGDVGPGAPLQIMVVPFGTLSPDVTPQHIADALVRAVATVAPEAQWASDGQPQVVASPTVGPGAGDLFGGGGVLVRQISGHVDVSIGTRADGFVCPAEGGSAGAGHPQACGLGTSPGGATMAIWRDWDGSYPDWTVSWRVDLALADGLVLEAYAYASKQLQYGPLGPVLSQSELVTVVEDMASRLTT